jgi:hypothetical protein
MPWFNGKAVKNCYKECQQFVLGLRSFSLAGIARFLFLKIRGKSILVTGSCRGCGACCKSICLEGASGWLRSQKEFQEIVKKYSEYKRFEIIGKDQQGLLLFRCSWCTAQGTCLDYDNRLPLCRNFPESSLVFAGGSLPDNCGYSFVEVVPFAKILQRELKQKR